MTLAHLQRLSKVVLLLAFIVITPARAAAQVYTVLMFDPKGDARDPALGDAAQLAYHYDKEQDMVSRSERCDSDVGVVASDSHGE